MSSKEVQSKLNIKQLNDDKSYRLHEPQVQDYWKKIDIVKKLKEKNKNGKAFRFMDGPPFVSSKFLHYGHMLIGIIKSIVLNYKNMQGFDCDNKLGFDCHGLPIEQVANNDLKVRTNTEVEALGIDVYITYCRNIVNSFSGQWEPIYNKIGRLCDFKNTYKTQDWQFMESVWWVFNQMWKKGLIYRGYKVMPYSTACSTCLSNFEAKQNYIDKQDSTIYVCCPIKNNESHNFLFWTTTPWTVPSNLMLAIHGNEMYATVASIDKNSLDVRKYIVAEKLVKLIFDMSKYEIIDRKLGKDYIGTAYIPPYNYYYNNNQNNKLFTVIAADFVQVNEDSIAGTGIVHIAPAFGEDDFNVCIKNGILGIEEVGNYCPVDVDGKFTNIVVDFTGNDVSETETNKLIIIDLCKKNLVIKKQQYTHRYPLCPRTDKPLIYMIVPSFFVAVTKIKDEIIANNKKTIWTPAVAGSNRFESWLENAEDWGITRKRYHATPIPIWMSEDGKEIVCIESCQDLAKRANLKEVPTDLHRDFIDKIQIPSSEGRGMLSRVSDGFDCWFESGCVPFGQQHYPFENEHAFDNVDYLSDFICEGLDQTRGWFYTLSVIATAILNKPAFRNVICTGLVLAADGKKMAKRLNNFPDPNELLDKIGADSLRAYFIDSPLVEAQEFNFDKDSVIKTKFKLVQWSNCTKFLLEHTINYTKTNGDLFDILAYKKSANTMDNWIMHRLKSLTLTIEKLMERYELNKVMPKLFEFIEDLANWYLKFNRDRLKGLDGNEEWQLSLATLYYIQYEFNKIMAPFCPMLSEHFYQHFRSFNKSSVESVLLLNITEASSLYCNDDYDSERKMKRLQEAVSLIGLLRNEKKETASVRIPLKMATIYHQQQEYLDDIKSNEQYLYDEELNVLNIQYQILENATKYSLIPNNKSLGIKYRKAIKDIVAKMKEISQDTIALLYNGTTSSIELNINDVVYKLENDDFSIIAELTLNNNNSNIIISKPTSNNLIIAIDGTQDNEVKILHTIRLFSLLVQKMRKDAGLRPWNRVIIAYQIICDDDNKFDDVIVNNMQYLDTKLHSPIIKLNAVTENKLIIKRQINFKELFGVDYKYNIDIALFSNE